MMSRRSAARQAESGSDTEVSVKEGARGAVCAVRPARRPERKPFHLVIRPAGANLWFAGGGGQSAN